MEDRLYAAARSVVLNPVRANLVKNLQEYRWNRPSAPIVRRDDRLAYVDPFLEMFGKWNNFLSRGPSDKEIEKLRCYERTGRPPSIDGFIIRLENVLGRILHKKKPGLKVLQKNNGNFSNEIWHLRNYRLTST